jgi:hypothetical protein
MNTVSSPPFLTVTSAPTSGGVYSRSLSCLCVLCYFVGAVDGGEVSNVVTVEKQVAALLTHITRVHSFVDSSIVSFASWYVIITYHLSEILYPFPLNELGTNSQIFAKLGYEHYATRGL